MVNVKKIFFALGTANSIEAECGNGQEQMTEKVLNSVKAKILMMDDRLSVFKAYSEVSEVNSMAGEGTVKVSEDTYKIIEAAVKYARLTRGLFDITSWPVSKLWGIGFKEGIVPSDDEIKMALPLVNYKDIILEEPECRAGLRKKGQKIDLGGIAKGYAADTAAKILKANGITDACINFGGTVVNIGKSRKIGIQRPWDKEGEAALYVNLQNVKTKVTGTGSAAVTSGIYEHYFLSKGRRYHHIMDVSTGYPSDTGICSATLIGASAMEMDALATSVILLGAEKGMELSEKNNAECILIMEDGKVFSTPGISGNIQIIKQNGNK